ncbi:Holliday junction resolvase RuvX [Anaplasmataceae bacterium AB001_6]|nr:Holliday junction resolvase RuvX [Anaplasmataceae bacterium AB001_6]
MKVYNNITQARSFAIKGKILLSLDMGRKRIGIATSDIEHVVASPLEIYKRRSLESDLLYIKELFCSLSACLLIIGFPNLHFRNDGWLEQIKDFAKDLSVNHDIPCCFQDEHNSSSAIVKSNNRPKKNGKYYDDKSAAFILQSSLEFL